LFVGDEPKGFKCIFLRINHKRNAERRSAMRIDAVETFVSDVVSYGLPSAHDLTGIEHDLPETEYISTAIMYIVQAGVHAAEKAAKIRRNCRNSEMFGSKHHLWRKNIRSAYLAHLDRIFDYHKKHTLVRTGSIRSKHPATAVKEDIFELPVLLLSPEEEKPVRDGVNYSDEVERYNKTRLEEDSEEIEEMGITYSFRMTHSFSPEDVVSPSDNEEEHVKIEFDSEVMGGYFDDIDRKSSSLPHRINGIGDFVPPAGRAEKTLISQCGPHVQNALYGVYRPDPFDSSHYNEHQISHDRE